MQLHVVVKRKLLKNNRFLHMKSVLARTVDALVVKRDEVSTHIQSEHIPGRRPPRTQHCRTPPDYQDSHGKT